MSLRHLILFRRLSTCRPLRLSILSDNYTSKKLWDERYCCKLLSGDENILRSINSKIIMGNDLDNLEVDIFINIATPRSDEIAQLQEAVRLLSKFRKSLYAHTLLPSTPHAVCRLFLDSQRLSSLITILEDRVKYGIFPDPFAFNLLLNEALDRENYVLASRLTSLVMLQEEFGVNPITDRLALLSVANYIESRTDFQNWTKDDALEDPILTGDLENDMQEAEKSENKDEAKEEVADEDEDDAEYIRIPFLRNPYFDGHFDITNPRIICGKTLSVLGTTFEKQNNELGMKSSLIGSILQGKWLEAVELFGKCVQSSIELGSIKELLLYYIENLNGIDGPSDEQKKSLMSSLEQVTGRGQCLSELAKQECVNFGEFESHDIDQLRASFSDWAELRLATQRAQEEKEDRDKLITEIRAKKEELKLKEQYLYFYDNLKKSRITRIEYN